MSKFDRQRNAIDNALDEIKQELIEEIRWTLFKMSQYKKYEGMEVGYVCGMGTFYLYYNDPNSSMKSIDLNNFNLIGRLCRVVEKFGAFRRGEGMKRYITKHPLVFHKCRAIPEGHIWCIGKEGGADRWEGKIG